MSVNEKKNRVFISLLLLSLAMFFLFPLKDVFADFRGNLLDLWFRDNESFFAIAKKNFFASGLISEFFSNPLDMLPHFFQDDFEYWKIAYQSIKIGAIFISIWIFIKIISHITSCASFGWVFLGFFWIVLQNLVYFDPINGYIISAHLPLIFFAFSLLFFHLYFKKLKFILLIFSVLFYIICLCLNEAFFLFFLLFIFMSFVNFGKNLKPFGKNLKIYFFLPTMFFLVGVLIYGGIYFFLHINYDLTSPFVKFNEFISKKTFETYLQFTASGLPLYNLINWSKSLNVEIFSETYQGNSDFTGNFLEALRVTRVSWLTKALIAAGFPWLVIPLVRLKNFAVYKIAFIGFSFVIFPNIFYAILKNYQKFHIENNFLNSIATYYNQIGWSMLICIFFCEIYRWSSYIFKPLGKITLCVFSICMFIFSFGTDFWNFHTHLKEKLNSKKWQAVDVLLNDKYFQDKVSKNAVILATSLFENKNDWESYIKKKYRENDYWTKYFNSFSQKNYTIIEKPEQFEEIVKSELTKLNPYCIVYREQKKSGDNFLLLSDILGLSGTPEYINIDSSEGILFHHSKNNTFYLSAKYKSHKYSKIKIPSANKIFQNGDYFFANISKNKQNKPIEIHCTDSSFDPTTINLSYYPVKKHAFIKKIIKNEKFSHNFQKIDNLYCLMNDNQGFIRIQNDTDSKHIAYLNMKLQASNMGEIILYLNKERQLVYKFDNNNIKEIKNQKFILQKGNNIISIESTIKTNDGDIDMLQPLCISEFKLITTEIK